MNNKTRKWIRAGAEAFITGATAGTSAPIGASFIDPKDWGLSFHSLELFGWTALIGGGFRFWHWWGTNPLPPEDDTVPPVPGYVAPIISINPLAQREPPVAKSAGQAPAPPVT